MTAPHDRPTARELLESVREWIERDLAPSLEGRLAFHSRVAANILDMVSREIETSAEAEAAHAVMLSQFGVTSNQELSGRIRAGDFDADMATTIARLRPVIRHKVWVANPRHLED